MNHHQTLTYPATASRATRSAAAQANSSDRRRVRTGSPVRRLPVILATLIQVAIVVLAVELTLGVGFDSQPGPMPAPVPAPGLGL